MITTLNEWKKYNENRSNYVYPKGWAVLNAGTINLKNGDTKYFNVIENLDGREGTLVLVKNGSKYLVISSSSSIKYYKEKYPIGSYAKAYHDQTFRPFSNDLLIVGYYKTNEESLNKIKEIIGKNTASFAVFK